MGLIQIQTIKAGGKQAKSVIEDLGRLADPFDPESDGEFGNKDIKKLRSTFKTVI